MRKQSKQSLSAIQRKIWVECRRIVYERDKNPDGTIDCYTCPAKDLQGSNRQLGHGPWPKSTLGAYLKYDFRRVLRFQCARCNLFHGGMGAEFYKRLKNELGEGAFSQLEKDRQKTVKAMTHYIALLAEYSKL